MKRGKWIPVSIVFVCAVSAPAQTFSTLWTFNSPYVAGSESALTLGSDGNFYGTTFDGGTNDSGTVFKTTPAGAFTTLYNFGSSPGDGFGPSALVLGSDGNFYGTTQGNANNVGTFFRITPGGMLTTLFTFTLATENGALPQGIIKGADGNFYGTTFTGGPHDGGTIFQVTPAGSLTTLYGLSPGETGNGLSGTLLQGSDGYFYGTISSGGLYNGGSIYKYQAGGALTILYSFGGESNPGPPGTLIQGSDGLLYGTTNPGNSLAGTIYRITTAGVLTTLYSFQGPDNGTNPTALIQGADGSFYGLTSESGADNSGTIFRFIPGGTLTTLHQFQYLTDGAVGGDLIQAPNGALYGTTDSGGAYGQGTIFTLTLPPLPPPSTPVITSVTNAFSGSSTIAPNTWITIKGSNLAPPGDSRTWQAADFAGNQMPSKLDGVVVSMNGEPAYVYYISPGQINVLTPPDLALGSVLVTVADSGLSSAPFTAQAQAESLAFFVFNGGPYVVATHLDGSDIGPASLIPGLTSPAQAGGYAILYATGFGDVSSPIVNGATVQSGTLPSLPLILIAGLPATVQFAGLAAPGLFQFNVVVPESAANGDDTLVAQYDGQSTQSGVLLTVEGSHLPKIQNLTFSASSVASGNTVQGTVTLSSAAPLGGLSVILSSSSNAVVLPPVAAIPGGSTSASFAAMAETVSSAQAVTITAALTGSIVNATLTVTPH